MRILGLPGNKSGNPKSHLPPEEHAARRAEREAKAQAVAQRKAERRSRMVARAQEVADRKLAKAQETARRKAQMAADRLARPERVFIKVPEDFGRSLIQCKYKGFDRDVFYTAFNETEIAIIKLMMTPVTDPEQRVVTTAQIAAKMLHRPTSYAYRAWRKYKAVCAAECDPEETEGVELFPTRVYRFIGDLFREGVKYRTVQQCANRFKRVDK